MKVLILGASQVGVSIAEVLVSENNDVTIVDLNKDQLTHLQNRLDIRTVAGHASSPSLLRKAGAEDASLLLAVTNNDEVNIVACQIADAIFDTPTKIARIRSKDYLTESHLFGKSHSFKIDNIISPESIVTDHVAKLIEFIGTLQVLDFADGLVQLVGVKVTNHSALKGQRLADIKTLIPTVKMRVAAIYRDQTVIQPIADTIIQARDEVFIVAERKYIREIVHHMCGTTNKSRQICIAGGGNIGFNLALALEKQGYSVKLIEFNHTRASTIADMLENTIVLSGDATDIELLVQENIESTDVFCSVTERDEVNILSAMLAKQLGARRVMALVNHSAYIDHIEHADIDIIISPPIITIGSILAHIRHADVVAVHSLLRGKAEAIEVIAHGDENSSKVVGLRVHEIPLPDGAGVGAIVRDKRVIIPDKNMTISSEDHVIVFVIDKKSISQVEALFQVDVTFI